MPFVIVLLKLILHHFGLLELRNLVDFLLLCCLGSSSWCLGADGLCGSSRDCVAVPNKASGSNDALVAKEETLELVVGSLLCTGSMEGGATICLDTLLATLVKRLEVLQLRPVLVLPTSSTATSFSKQSYVNVSLKVDDHVLLLAGNLLLLLSKAVRDGVADSSHRGRVAGRNNAL